jgi:hypothetical protein
MVAALVTRWPDGRQTPLVARVATDGGTSTLGLILM